MAKKFEDWANFGYEEVAWKALTKTQRYNIRYPERRLSSSHKYADANRQYMSDRQRKYHLWNNYGITEEDYEVLLKTQDGKCAICSTDKPTGKWKRFAVDHCHHTGQIRGILCNECNRGIGLLKDNETLLRVAAEYLESHKAISKQENMQRRSDEILP